MRSFTAGGCYSWYRIGVPLPLPTPHSIIESQHINLSYYSLAYNMAHIYEAIKPLFISASEQSFKKTAML